MEANRACGGDFLSNHAKREFTQLKKWTSVCAENIQSLLYSLLRDTMTCAVRFGNCFLRISLMYQPCSLCNCHSRKTVLDLESIFLTGLAKFVTAAARLVCLDLLRYCLACPANIYFGPSMPCCIFYPPSVQGSTSKKAHY